jgi:hypothetical protein
VALQLLRRGLLLLPALAARPGVGDGARRGLRPAPGRGGRDRHGHAASGDSVSVLVLLGTAREAALAPWVIRANEFLRPHSLSVAVYNWIEQTRDDKGNQTGEILRCAVQVYAGPGSQAMLTAQPVAYAAASHGGQLVYQPAAEQFLNPQQYSHQVYPAGYAGAQSATPAGYAGAPKQLY